MTNDESQRVNLIGHSTFENSSFAPMYYIDPHIHMVSRTTDDYETLAKMGCVAVSEPAFWAGYDRGSVDGFCDYFEQLTAFEPKRAAASKGRESGMRTRADAGAIIFSARPPW